MKKKDKEERKKDREENNLKGAGLEDMMAYLEVMRYLTIKWRILF